MVQVLDKELSILHRAISEYFRQIKTPAAQEIVKMGKEAEKLFLSKMVKANAPLGGSSAPPISSTNKNLFEMFGLAHRVR